MFSAVSSRVQNSSYRPEIDGLRALAVIAVIMFHAKMALSGGYLGVDVFFVISGYLITSLIVLRSREKVLLLSSLFGSAEFGGLFPPRA